MLRLLPIFVIVLCSLLSGCDAWLEDRSENFIGEVELAVGVPRVLRGLRHMEIGLDTNLEKGDTILTGPDDKALIRMVDGTRVWLGNNTQFSFDDYSYGNTTPRAQLGFTEGAFRIDTGRFMRNSSAIFEISTPIATIGVRGTDFWGGYIFGDNTLDVALLSRGGIYVRNAYGEVDITERGEGTTVQLTKAPSAPIPWSEEKTEEAIASTSL